ncbi:MAG: helix-turn-helix transcriptional regulator [Cyanobacteria bacterium P01_A01_bin.80]
MPVINNLKLFLEKRGITVYRFREDCKISNTTAYNLCNKPEQVPHPGVLNKICDFYEIQPGEILKWEKLRSENENK